MLFCKFVISVFFVAIMFNFGYNSKCVLALKWPCNEQWRAVDSTNIVRNCLWKRSFLTEIFESEKDFRPEAFFRNLKAHKFKHTNAFFSFISCRNFDDQLSPNFHNCFCMLRLEYTKWEYWSLSINQLCPNEIWNACSQSNNKIATIDISFAKSQPGLFTTKLCTQIHQFIN